MKRSNLKTHNAFTDTSYLKISASAFRASSFYKSRQPRVVRTYRQVDSGGHPVELHMQRILGAGQGREASGPVRRQRGVGVAGAPVDPEDPEGVLSETAAVLH